MTLKPPPNPFPPINCTILPAGTILHRTHASSFRPAQFNPCLGQPSRFAPFTNPSGACVPTLYAATTLGAAAFETIFHDIPAEAAFKTIRLNVLTARAVSRIEARRDLRLANLFTPDLKAWRLQRRDLIETAKSAYPQTARWAQAVHAADRSVDGLIWTSRQCDPDRCTMLFGDRVLETDFAVTERLEVGTAPALLLELRRIGRRAGIVVIS